MAIDSGVMSALSGGEGSHGEMKVIVDYELCEANAVCVKVCPEVFEVDDNDILNLKTSALDESLRAKVEEAVRRCPRQALSIEKS